MKEQHDKKELKELQITKSEPTTLPELFSSIVDKANTMLAANREPDPVRRKRILEIISKGTKYICKIVPFKRRPRSVAELILGDKIKLALKNLEERSK